VIAIALSAAGAHVANAQTPAPSAPPPPPLWDVQIGASFVGTTGNSQTSSLGGNAEAHRRWPVWTVDALGTVVRSTVNGVDTAEQYIAAVRGGRRLTDRISATTGLRLERDPIGGIDLRSILDGGLMYDLVKDEKWTVNGLTTLAWNHESRVTGESVNSAQALLGVTSKYVLGSTGETTQRFAFYPNFSDSSAYRSEAEVTAQAAMNQRLALKLGFLWRYSNSPVPGFKKSDTTTTASVVVRWKSDQPAPGR